MTIQEAMQTALAHQRSGQFAQAEAIYRQVLSQSPDEPEVLALLGILCSLTNRAPMGIELIRRAARLRPEDARIHHSLAGVLRSNGNIDEALAAFNRAIQLKSDVAEFHLHRADTLRLLGRNDDAIAAYRQAISLNPKLSDAHANLGAALKDSGRLEESIAAYRRASELNPNSADAHYNLGVVLSEGGQLDQAITANRRAIALNPKLPEAFNNLGNALRDKGQHDEAIAAFEQALALRPDYVEVRYNLGNCLMDRGQVDDAIAAFRLVLTANPDFAGAHSQIILAMHYHPDLDAKSIADELHRWSEKYAQPLGKFTYPHSNDRDPDRRLRIGYVSPDFREHVVGRNVLPLFRQHDHARFEIFSYAQVKRPDGMTARFQECSDHWRNTIDLSDDRLAEQIRRDGIDILVDLALHTSGNRLMVFAAKPAPVQVTFAGYPASTGLHTIDYRLSDPYLDPPGMDESVYSEKTFRLPETFWCYDPMECGDICVGSQPAAENGFVTFGCLNNFSKINNRVLGLWAEILGQVKHSRLLLLTPHGSHRQRTLDQLARDGIDPQRIEFLPRQSRRKYLEAYRRIDLSLDSFPYNGHTTSLDSLWMGVPVVTLVGQTAVARAGWSQLSNLGLTELAAQSLEQYVSLAVELASDLPKLQQLRRILRQRMEKSSLMDAAKFARNIEAAYRRMWQTWCETIPSQ